MNDVNVGKDPELKELVDRVVTLSKESDDRTLEAAKAFRKACDIVDAHGEKWMEWAPKAFEKKLSKSRVYELRQIAFADDQKKALETIRQRNRDRQQKWRDRANPVKAKVKKTVQHSPRAKLLAWAKKAPMEQVDQALNLIAAEFGIDGDGADESRSEREVRDAA